MKRIIKREIDFENFQLLYALSRGELLTVEDEVKLVRQIRQGEGDVETAKERLVCTNQRFVRKVAMKYVSERITLDELMTEGNKGLITAIYKFDETKGFKFISYALWWIRQSIQQYIAKKAREEGALKELSERELDIIRMSFGFGCEKANLTEIQAKYGLTPQRTMYIMDKALRKLFKSNREAK